VAGGAAPGEAYTEDFAVDVYREGEEPTAQVTIKTTTSNSAGLTLGTGGGSGTSFTRNLSAPNGTAAAYFTVLKKASQTLIVSGKDAAKLTKAPSGAAVDGETPNSTRDLFTVDSSGIADPGGTLEFVITVTESGKQNIRYALTFTVAGVTRVQAWLLGVTVSGGYKLTYAVGEPFDRDSVRIAAFYSDGTTVQDEKVYEVEGFDSSAVGSITVRFKKGGQYAETNYGSGAVPMTIISPASEPRLFFWYGDAIKQGVSQRDRYTVTQGKTLVIAPVCWRIPTGAAFQWTVSGGSYTSSGEFLTFTGMSTGTYNVTVTATFPGGSAQASTTVECVNGSGSASEIRAESGTCFAPGQFVEPNWGTSLGGYGGYMVLPATNWPNDPGDDFLIQGNAWGNWAEPGIIWVMKDENRNGKADDTWYELRGNAEAHSMTVIRRYAVTYNPDRTWEDSLGNYGTLGPLQKIPSIQGSQPFTIAGTCIMNRNDTSGGYFQGYVDTVDQFYNIDDAIQADGTPLSPPLDRIDFVMVQTAEHIYDPGFGEISTEFTSGVEPVWSEGRSFTGVENGSGGYSYQIVNNSGYDLTITFKDVSGTWTVNGGQTETITRPESKLYFNYGGGNVYVSVNGNKLTFVDG
jgi:hypothetical protein